LAILIGGLFSRTDIGVAIESSAKSRRASFKDLDFELLFAELLKDSSSVPVPAWESDSGSRATSVAKPKELTVDRQLLSEVLFAAPRAMLCLEIPTPVELSILAAAVMGMEEAHAMPKGKEMG